jgi:hypothetical protein
MTYNPVTDFMALVRLTAGAASVAKMPGLDYVVAAMARANMFSLHVSQTAPIVNQESTVWLKPSLPSWVAEGVVYLWDGSGYAVATAELWGVLFGLVGREVFQSTAISSAVVGVNTTLFAIQRTNPVSTVISLPSVASKRGALKLVDWSINVVEHQITLEPNGADTIMQAADWQLFSTPDQMAGLTLYPSTDLDGWVIAP